MIVHVAQISAKPTYALQANKTENRPEGQWILGSKQT